jgi:hypothetical protein
MEKETKLTQSPFDLYDVFGYIVPGLILLISIVSLMFQYGNDLPIRINYFMENHTISSFDLKSMKESTPWWLEITLLVTLLSIVYIIGHIIASISSLLIDKYLIRKISGYPSEILFKIENTDKFKKGYYKLFFFIINIYLIRLFYFTRPRLVEIVLISLFIALLIIAKFIVSTKNIKNRFRPQLDKIGDKISIPFNFIIKFIVHSFSLNEPFSEEFINIYNSKFKEWFNMDISHSKTNLYWLSYCYVVDRNEHMRDVIRHFLRLYGFTRNLSTTFFLIFLFILSIKLNGSQHSYQLNILGTLSLLSSIILVIRFYYLYYNYYSKFIFRSFMYLSQKK